MISEEKGIAGALALLIVSLLFILLAYTYVAYPFVTVLNNTVTSVNLWTPESKAVFNNAVMALGVVGIIISVGLFIWLLARLTKKEEFEWLR